MADNQQSTEYADALPQNGAETTQETNAIEQSTQGGGDASQESTKLKPGDKIHASKDEDDGTKLFIGGLSWETNPKGLTTYFSKYGTVVDAIVKTEQLPDSYGSGSVPGKSRGFGFVKFSEAAAVQKILEEKDGHTIDGKVVDCKIALPQRLAKEPRVKKLFVGGLPNEVTEEQLREYFSQYGTISEDKGPAKGITLPTDQTGQKRRGFAFILFDDEESVEKIVAQKQFHDIGEHRVEVKKALPQQEHQARTMGYPKGGFFGGRGRVPRGEEEGAGVVITAQDTITADRVAMAMVATPKVAMTTAMDQADMVAMEDMEGTEVAMDTVISIQTTGVLTTTHHEAVEGAEERHHKNSIYSTLFWNELFSQEKENYWQRHNHQVHQLITSIPCMGLII